MAGSDKGEGVLTHFEESTRDAIRLQRETLNSILDRNARVGYLRPYLGSLLDDGGGGSSSPVNIDADTFRRLVPISSYERDYAHHIQRIADGGDGSVLSFDPLLCFFYSSGTSSMKPKMIPYYDTKHGRASAHAAHQLGAAFLERHIPPREKTTNKVLWFLYAGNVTETKCGLKAMAASAFPMQNRTAKASSPLFNMCISPPEVLLGSDPNQQMYCHLICGLSRFESIAGIRAPYAAGLARAFRLLESKWEQLCSDIECGSLSTEIISEPAMKLAVEDFLGGPRPDIAERVRRICSEEENWGGGIIRKLWPEVRFVAGITTGTMEQYYPVIKHFAGEGMPLLGGDYFSSECCIGVNTNKILPPKETRFVVLPTAAYFEFLPFKTDGDAAAEAEVAEAVDISGVEVGKLYEVVVTTYRGLYRYRLGDVVKVAGFYNSSPELEFVTRAPKNDSDIFTERDLMAAMEDFQVLPRDEHAGKIAEYTCVVAPLDAAVYKHHAVIFVEAREGWALLEEENRGLLEEVLQRYARLLDGCLGRRSSVYKVRRASGELGSLEMCVVKCGSFDGLMRLAFESGAPANQYKTPKILRNDRLAALLRESVVVSASS